MNKYSEYVNTDELRKARREKNKTYQDMSQSLGFKSPITYYNLEVGFTEPKISQMIAVSKILNKPVKKLFNFNIQEN